MYLSRRIDGITGGRDPKTVGLVRTTRLARACAAGVTVYLVRGQLHLDESKKHMSLLGHILGLYYYHIIHIVYYDIV